VPPTDPAVHRQVAAPAPRRRHAFGDAGSRTWLLRFPYPWGRHDHIQVRGAAVIRFDQVSKRYEGGHEALSQLSFQVAPGEMAFVTGHSGAGKSTLLKLLGLIERPSHGSITLDGQNLAKIGRGGIPKLRRRIGMVFQDHRLLMERTV